MERENYELQRTSHIVSAYGEPEDDSYLVTSIPIPFFTRELMARPDSVAIARLSIVLGERASDYLAACLEAGLRVDDLVSAGPARIIDRLTSAGVQRDHAVEMAERFERDAAEAEESQDADFAAVDEPNPCNQGNHLYLGMGLSSVKVVRF